MLDISRTSIWMGVISWFIKQRPYLGGPILHSMKSSRISHKIASSWCANGIPWNAQEVEYCDSLNPIRSLIVDSSCVPSINQYTGMARNTSKYHLQVKYNPMYEMIPQFHPIPIYNHRNNWQRVLIAEISESRQIWYWKIFFFRSIRVLPWLWSESFTTRAIRDYYKVVPPQFCECWFIIPMN